jgi:glutathione S-transferase
MIQLYGSVPAWTVPCLGPMVTKVAYYLTLAKLPFEFVPTDLSQLDRDSPNGKVPFLDDDGTRIADSMLIIEHLRRCYADVLGEGVTPREAAAMLAFNRLIDDHLYWIAVVQPRYVADADWQYYLRLIARTDVISLELQAFGDAWRARVLVGFEQGGWTRLSRETLYARARQDMDALSDHLGDRPFFMGEQPRWIDASVLSILRHVIEAPFSFDTRHYGEQKTNLLAYMARMKQQFAI